MVRNDGDYTIFILQFWADMHGRGADWHYTGDGGHYLPSIDYRNKTPEPRISFTACGDCWQQTGIHGTYDYDIAHDFLKLVAKTAPDRKFRIARLEIFQRTTGVCEMDGSNL